MAQTSLQPDWLNAHMQRQRDEWDALEPEFEKFRSTPEEVSSKAVEDAAELLHIEQAKLMPSESARVFLWGQNIARSAREGVRFERWRYPHIHSQRST
jgi:hypothetical protein